MALLADNSFNPTPLRGPAQLSLHACMRLAFLLFALGPAAAASADELGSFKDAASAILVERNLENTEQGTYVCISIEGRAPIPTQLASYQKLGIGEVGPPSECEC